MIFVIDSFKSSKAISKITNETASEQTYSILSWPYGCSLSAGFDEILKETNETMLLPQSVRLFKPSAMTEISPNKAPTMIFPTAKKMLAKIPTMLAKVPLCSLDFVFVINDYSLKSYFARFIILDKVIFVNIKL